MATVSDNRIVMSVADIRKKLAEQVKLAKAYDRERLAAHREQEKQWERAAKTALREAAKLSYSELSELHNYKAIDVQMSSPPTCPKASAPAIEQWVERFKSDSRDIVHVEPNGALDRVLTWRPGGYSEQMC